MILLVPLQLALGIVAAFQACTPELSSSPSECSSHFASAGAVLGTAFFYFNLGGTMYRTTSTNYGLYAIEAAVGTTGAFILLIFALYTRSVEAGSIGALLFVVFVGYLLIMRHYHRASKSLPTLVVGDYQ